MPSNQVHADSVLDGAIRSEFVGAYNSAYSGLKNRFGSVMRFDIPSDKAQEIFAYFESAPYARRWRRGDEATFDSFGSVNWTVINHDWVSGVTWHEDDEQDDMTRSLPDRGRDAGNNFGLTDERVFFQIMLGSTDGDLLPAIPNAPDGADLYNATDGAGADRFGVSGGNIVASQTLTTAAGIRAALFNAMERAGQFQDTKGQPLWNYDMLNSMTVFYNVANDQLVREATIQGRTLQVQTGTSTTDTSTAAAVTNIIVESGVQINLAPTQRITTNNLYVFFDKAPQKALFTLARQGLRETPFDRTNSDSGRLRKEKGILWDNRRGYGVFLPYQTIECTA